MNSCFQAADINSAYHFAVFIGNRCSDLICWLLQLNAKRRGGGFRALFRTFTGQEVPGIMTP